MAEERRPRDMQGLLHFCTALTAKEDAPNTPSVEAMDPERRKFLQDVLSSMTVSVAKKMAEHLQTLANSDKLNSNDSDVESEEFALEELVELVQDVDNANDLRKMGGLPVLYSCLSSSHPVIVELSCEVIGVICQNNPNCQAEVLQSGVLETLLQLTNKNHHMLVRLKAIYAISCLVRGYEPAIKEFGTREGYSYLLEAMQSNNDKLFIKSIFLIVNLIQENPTSIDKLLVLDYPHFLINYLCSNNTVQEEDSNENTTSLLCKEHCTSALLSLCSESSKVKYICCNDSNLSQYLPDRLKVVEGMDECQEEAHYITELLKIIKAQSLHEHDESR